VELNNIQSLRQLGCWGTIFITLCGALATGGSFYHGYTQPETFSIPHRDPLPQPPQPPFVPDGGEVIPTPLPANEVITNTIVQPQPITEQLATAIPDNQSELQVNAPELAIYYLREILGVKPGEIMTFFIGADDRHSHGILSQDENKPDYPARVDSPMLIQFTPDNKMIITSIPRDQLLTGDYSQMPINFLALPTNNSNDARPVEQQVSILEEAIGSPVHGYFRFGTETIAKLVDELYPNGYEIDITTITEKESFVAQKIVEEAVGYWNFNIFASEIVGEDTNLDNYSIEDIEREIRYIIQKNREAGNNTFDPDILRDNDDRLIKRPHILFDNNGIPMARIFTDPTAHINHYFGENEDNYPPGVLEFLNNNGNFTINGQQVILFARDRSGITDNSRGRQDNITAIAGNILTSVEIGNFLIALSNSSTTLNELEQTDLHVRFPHAGEEIDSISDLYYELIARIPNSMKLQFTGSLVASIGGFLQTLKTNTTINSTEIPSDNYWEQFKQQSITPETGYRNTFAKKERYAIAKAMQLLANNIISDQQYTALQDLLSAPNRQKRRAAEKQLRGLL
jgi:hypothetical protein